MTKIMGEKDEREEAVEQKPDPGVFITKGMQVSIPDFSLRIGPDGNIEAGPVNLHTGLDLCPYWLEIAYGHLLSTEKASNDLLSAKDEQNDERIAEALQAESQQECKQ